MREVLAKVALGEADAGFVYSTDAKTVPGQVTVLKVPAWAQPKVQYGICVVSKSGDKADAQAFINKVLSKAGQAKMLAYGFLPACQAGREEEVDGRTATPRLTAGDRPPMRRAVVTCLYVGAGRRHAGVPRVPDRGDLRPHLARATCSTSSRTRSFRTRSSSA